MKKEIKYLKKLNLGCEDKILPRFINVDIDNHEGVDLVYDLEKYPLPFKEDSIEYILCSHVLEHLNNPTKFLFELHRICKKEATIDLFVPHFSCFATYADFTHKHPGFSYFSLGENWTNKQLYKKFKVQKKLNFTRTNFKFLNKIFNPFINLFPTVYERFFCYLLPCSEVKFRLKVIK